jgi:hypothetical protein
MSSIRGPGAQRWRWAGASAFEIFILEWPSVIGVERQIDNKTCCFGDEEHMTIHKYPLLMLAILFAGWNHPIAAQEHKAGHEWDYDSSEGPDHWGDLKPEFAPCKTGHLQSPIDIRSPRTADLPAIEFLYKTSSLDIIDNGHTIMINYAPGSHIRVGDKQYELKQFHFHKPSEEKINTKAYDMVVPLGLAAVLAGWARWLEIRLPAENRRIPAWIWPACFVLIGAGLLSYREM